MSEVKLNHFHELIRAQEVKGPPYTKEGASPIDAWGRKPSDKDWGVDPKTGKRKYDE